MVIFTEWANTTQANIPQANHRNKIGADPGCGFTKENQAKHGTVTQFIAKSVANLDSKEQAGGPSDFFRKAEYDGDYKFTRDDMIGDEENCYYEAGPVNNNSKNDDNRDGGISHVCLKIYTDSADLILDLN